jgi:hypothetical protein
MYSLNQVKKLVSCGRDSARSLPLWRGFLLIPLILVCFAFAQQAQAISPTPDGCYPSFNTAEGCGALQNAPFGAGNTALGWRVLFAPQGGNFNTGVGAASVLLTQGDANTGVGTASLLFNVLGDRNTAVGAAALLNDTGDAAGNGAFNGAVGAFALNSNTTGFSNNAMGDSALFRNQIAAANTAVGDLALENNDATGDGDGNNNTAVGASALNANVNGSENTAVGAGVGTNIANGFNNTYIGNFVGSALAQDGTGDEDGTIRINDISNGNGAGSLQCYIGGIWNNEQPLGTNVVLVTLNLTNDHLGWTTLDNAATAPQRAVPQPRGRPQTGHQAMLNELQTTVAQQQKQIETLTAQLREQAAQLQKVSAQVEMIRPTPRVVENR